MTRWKLTLEYDGRGFSGWQRQDHAVTVQGVLEDALRRFSGEAPTLHVAGRTDAGVHARAQVAHVDLEKETRAGEIQGALNFHVRPHRVSVLNVEQVSGDFHARFSALSRAYRYLIVNRRAPLALREGLAWAIARPLSVQAMEEAAEILIGTHDFSTFRAAGCQSNSPLKTLDALSIRRGGEDEDEIVISVRARSFLYHQVRNMVGTLALVGTGQWTLADFKAAFAAADRTKGGPTAPPDGLVFWDVTYPQF